MPPPPPVVGGGASWEGGREGERERERERESVAVSVPSEVMGIACATLQSHDAYIRIVSEIAVEMTQAMMKALALPPSPPVVGG